MKAKALDARFDNIDLLRGVAALSVVLYHARYEFWIGGRAAFDGLPEGMSILTCLDLLLMPFSLGMFGVPLFFVISGFCIQRSYSSIAKIHREPGAAKIFIWRRLVRIYPVYLAALGLTLVSELLSRYFIPGYAQADISLPTFLASAFTLQGIISGFYGNSTVFWTLSIEIHLYVLFALMAVTGALKYWKLTAWLVLGASICFVFIQWRWESFTKIFPQSADLGPVWLPYWWAWFVGAYLGFALDRAERTFLIPNIWFIPRLLEHPKRHCEVSGFRFG